MIDDESKKNSSFDELSTSAKEYVNLKIDEYKLRGVEGLSTLFNKILFIVIAAILGGVALQMLGLAAGYTIGELVHSTAAGFCIIGAIFVIAVLILCTVRKKLFLNQLIKVFIKFFFDDEQK